MHELHWFRGRRVLLTGHTGFKGAWLSLWLRHLGADVAGLSLEPASPSLFHAVHLDDEVRSHFGDVRDLTFVSEVMARERPEVVFHLAAQPLVRRSQREPVETFATNVQGTVHVLEAVRAVESVRAVVCVTSDKCYENRAWDWGYRENDPLGGDDPYSASKACAELTIRAYRTSFFERAEEPIGLASVRAGNVLGGGDWAEDRILPDALRALIAGRTIRLRRPGSVRPWQHVLDALAGYLALVTRLVAQPRSFSGPWNFGPQPDNAITVRDLIGRVIAEWGSGRAETQLDEGDEPIEAGYLRLAIDKAITRLPWRPLWNLETTVHHTLAWHRAHLRGASPDHLRDLCAEQIGIYEDTWQARFAPEAPILATYPLRRASA